MKTISLITGAALALAISTAAFAENPQDVPGSRAEGTGKEQNPGALTAPEKDKSTMSPNANSMAPDTGAADVPGSKAEGNKSDGNPGALSAPEKSAEKVPSTGGMSKEGAANVPGADADGDRSSTNQGSLSAPEKDKMNE
jgi:hypothetical protein